uniref:Anthranilate synthase component 2 n=1 Tax=Dichotomaria marginata TaxID=268567 RepID=A0A1G4NS21_9FLOR|nr:Anthranilate synthase component II [Dichotomaria marginata]SCW21453.1 Anthranilate synthase component II [Dichotomaria marginata]
MIIVIDNYDSFTYNLVQYIGTLGYKIKVIRNDAIVIDDIRKFSPDAIIISPGPGLPSDAGISLELIKVFAAEIPILGVCLGHQSIGAFLGAKIIHAPKPIHGKTSLIYHDNKGLFNSISNPFIATRYHSLIIDYNTIPDHLSVTAWTDDGIIMGCQHKFYPNLQGVQFHPESLWTDEGEQIIRNFLQSSYSNQS